MHIRIDLDKSKLPKNPWDDGYLVSGANKYFCYTLCMTNKVEKYLHQIGYRYKIQTNSSKFYYTKDFNEFLDANEIIKAGQAL